MRLVAAGYNRKGMAFSHAEQFALGGFTAPLKIVAFPTALGSY